MRSQSRGHSNEEYARLVIERDKGAPIQKDVNRSTTLIGSAPGCNIQLISTIVAPAHAVITLEKNQFRLRDLRTVNGTLVNGEQTELTTLNDGDLIRIGGVNLRFESNLYKSMMSEQADTQLLMALHHEPSAAANISHDYTINEADRLRRGSAFARLKFTHASGSVGFKDILRNTTLIGSAPGSNIQLIAETIAPAHALITLESEHLVLRDLRTRSGTRVNGRIVEVQELRHGDRIEIGNFLFTLETNLSNEETDISSLQDTQHSMLLNPEVRTKEASPVAPPVSQPAELAQTMEIEIPEFTAQVPAEEAITNQSQRAQFEKLLHEIDSREKKCEEQEGHLKKRLEHLEQREQDIGEREKEIQSAESRLLKTAQDFRIQYETFQAERSQSTSTQSQLDQQSHSLRELETKLVARQTELDLKQVDLNQREVELQKQEEQREVLQKELQEKQDELQYQLEELHKQTELIESRKEEILARVRKLESNEAILETAQEKLTEDQNKLVEEQGAVERLQTELQDQREQFEQEQADQSQKQIDQSDKISLLSTNLSEREEKVASQQTIINSLQSELSERHLQLERASLS
ncbi:MAG: FHA domain-containing protein [Planctomycetaceae bacterium]